MKRLILAAAILVAVAARGEEAASWRTVFTDPCLQRLIDTAAQASVEAAEARRQDVELKLVATVTNAYYRLLMLDSQLTIGEETLDSWAESVRTLEAMKRAGMTAETSVLQAKASRIELEGTLLTLRQNIHETEVTLCLLLAREPQPVERTVLDGQTAFNLLPSAVPAERLAARPDVREAEAAVRQACSGVSIAKAAFYPSLNLTGSAGWSNNAGGVELNPGRLVLNAVGSLVQPLFTQGHSKAALRRAQAEQEAAAMAFRQTLLNASGEVNNALEALRTARDQLALDALCVSTLEEAARSAELLYRCGELTALETLTVRQRLLDARLTQATTRQQALAAAVRLYESMGG